MKTEFDSRVGAHCSAVDTDMKNHCMRILRCTERAWGLAAPCGRLAPARWTVSRMVGGDRRVQPTPAGGVADRR